MSLAAKLQLLRIDSRALAGRVPASALLQSLRSRVGGVHTDKHCPTRGLASQHQRPRAAAACEGTEEAVEPVRAQADVPTIAIGQVMAAQANFVRIKVDRVEAAGSEPAPPPPRPRLLCVVRALLKKIKQNVLVGDYVRIVGIDWTDGRGMVEEVLPRSSRLLEPAVANVTHVLLVFSADMPPFQPGPATRYLLSAEAAGLPVTLVLNKADLLPAAEVELLLERVRSWGYEALPVSVVTGLGLEELTASLRGRVSVVAGPSGAGKSSIINALRLRSAGLEGTLEEMHAEASGPAGGDGQARGEESNGAAAAIAAAVTAVPQGAQDAAAEEPRSSDGSVDCGPAPPGGPLAPQLRPLAAVQLPPLPVNQPELQSVGQVSQRIGRGKHTTRTVTLLELGSGGLVVDTPGFNQPDLSMPANELADYFPEIRQRLEHERCTFQNCQHLQEPGCVVRGEWERYPLYCEIHAEVKELDEKDLQRAGSKRRREGMVRYKSRVGGRQGLEARLESKSHRRISRRSVRQKMTELARDAEEDDGVH